MECADEDRGQLAVVVGSGGSGRGWGGEGAVCSVHTAKHAQRREEVTLGVVGKSEGSRSVGRTVSAHPDWEKVISKAKVMGKGEDMVTFRPSQLGGAGELCCCGACGLWLS